MEKYAQIEANYQAKRLPKLRRGSDAQRRQGRSETAGGGAAGSRGAGGREEEGGKGKIEA